MARQFEEMIAHERGLVRSDNLIDQIESTPATSGHNRRHLGSTPVRRIYARLAFNICIASSTLILTRLIKASRIRLRSSFV